MASVPPSGARSAARFGAAVLAAMLLLCAAPRRSFVRAQSATAARVAFLHLSPDAPALDVYLDGGRAVQGLNFSEASPYVGLTVGTHQVQVTLSLRLDVLASGSLVAQAGASYTWVLSGVLNAAVTVPPASGTCSSHT